MKKVLCLIFILFYRPAFAELIEERFVYPIEFREYKAPVRIHLEDKGSEEDQLIGKDLETEEIQQKRACDEKKESVERKRKYLAEDPYKYTPNLTKYALSTEAEKEACDVTAPKHPFYAGYVMVYPKGQIDIFPTDNYLKAWLLYEAFDITFMGVEVPYFSDVGKYVSGEIDAQGRQLKRYLNDAKPSSSESKFGVGEGIASPRVLSTHPLFVPALIRYFERAGYRITKVEENVKLTAEETEVWEGLKLRRKLAKEFNKKAWNFIKHPPEGALVKRRKNANSTSYYVYDPKTEVMAISHGNEIRMMEKISPKSAENPDGHQYKTNEEYFNSFKAND